MAEPAAPVPAPAPPAAAVVQRGPGRAERRAGAIARLQATGAAATAAAGTPAEAPKPSSAPAAEAPKPAPAEPPKPADDKPDPATERGLRTIEQAKKKWQDEKAQADADYEVRVAKLAQREKEIEGRVTSRDDLKKLSPAELLDKLDHLSEDDHEALARAAYARTKAGKADPAAQAAARDAMRSSGSRTELAELRAKLDAANEEIKKLGGEFSRRDAASFAERWVGEAVKAIPSDKPTFLSKLHANEPDTARRELLAIGVELEKANDGEQPTHAEVIEEFEKRQRARIKAMGLDPDAMLAPPKPAPAPAAKPARTLDPAAPNVTRAENAPKTRDERREIAFANLRASRRTAADQ